MQGKQPRHCVFRPVASLLIALALAPAQAAPPRCTGIELVSLLTLEPRPLFELRYASPYNVLSTTLYPQLNPQLRCPVALALQQVQQAMWEAMTRRGFQAFPNEWWHFDWKTWSERPVVGR